MHLATRTSHTLNWSPDMPCVPLQMYYNTMVPIAGGPHAGRLMKYGVISVSDLIQDLQDWTWLYAAGRMHKPVRIIQHCKQHVPLYSATVANLDSALRASLLQLPESFSAEALYLKIAGLSYAGMCVCGVYTSVRCFISSKRCRLCRKVGTQPSISVLRQCIIFRANVCKVRQLYDLH